MEKNPLEQQLSGNVTSSIPSMLAQIKTLQEAIHNETLDTLCETLARDSTIRKECNHCNGNGTVYLSSKNIAPNHTTKKAMFAGYNYYGMGFGNVTCLECRGAGIVNYKIKTKEE